MYFGKGFVSSLAFLVLVRESETFSSILIPLFPPRPLFLGAVRCNPEFLSYPPPFCSGPPNGRILPHFFFFEWRSLLSPCLAFVEPLPSCFPPVPLCGLVFHFERFFLGGFIFLLRPLHQTPFFPFMGFILYTFTLPIPLLYPLDLIGVSFVVFLFLPLVWHQKRDMAFLFPILCRNPPYAISIAFPPGFQYRYPHCFLGFLFVSPYVIGVPFFGGSFPALAVLRWHTFAPTPFFFFLLFSSPECCFFRRVLKGKLLR